MLLLICIGQIRLIVDLIGFGDSEAQFGVQKMVIDCILGGLEISKGGSLH